jgi:hypothetical protein
MLRPLYVLTVTLVAPLAALGATATTIVLQFERPYSRVAVDEMKREMGDVLKASGLRFNWRLREDVGAADTFEDLIFVRFKGRCQMQPAPELLDERGPFAETYTTGGQVLPFTDVQCDKVRGALRSAMTGRDYKRGDFVMGRALGRVLAHEVYHVMAKTRGHGQHGVARSALSGSQLLSDHLLMDAEDLGKLTGR